MQLFDSSGYSRFCLYGKDIEFRTVDRLLVGFVSLVWSFGTSLSLGPIERVIKMKHDEPTTKPIRVIAQAIRANSK